MIRLAAERFVVLSLLCATFIFAAPAYAGATSRLQGASNATQISAPPRVASCQRAVHGEAQKISPSLPAVIRETAMRSCWISGDRDFGVGLLSTLSTGGLGEEFKKADRLIVLQGFNGQAQTEEPGLLGLSGVEEVLAELLRAEVKAIWAGAAEAGGPAVPGMEPIRGQATGAAPRRTGTGVRRRGASRQTVEQVEVETPEAEGAAAQDDLNLEITGMEIIRGESNVARNASGHAQKTFYQDYVDHHLTALRNDPDSALAIKVRMYDALKEIALKPRSQRTPAENRYYDAFEAYVKKQYQLMARAALDKYEEFKRKEAEKESLAIGEVFASSAAIPPNYYDEMMASIALGSTGLATSTAIASSLAFSAQAVKAAPGGFAAVSKAFAAGGAKSAAAIYTQATAMSATFSKVLSSATLAAGPAGIVTTAVIVAVLRTKEMIRGSNVEREMRALEAWARNPNVNLRQMLGTRDGLVQVQHFYAKATSSGSPTGFVNPADGCQVCLYADKNFSGQSVCITDRVPQLRQAPSGSETIDLNNKVSSVMVDRSKCEKGFAMLFDNTNLRGNERLVLRSSVADLASMTRGKNNTWDNVASSAGLINVNAPRCEVCVYNRPNQQGAEFCTSNAISALSSVGMANKITSVRMNTADCAGAKAWLYSNRDFQVRANGTGVTEVTSDIDDLGNGVRNTASSLYFSLDGSNPFEARASGGCRACMYDRPDQQGEYMCVNSNIPDMGNHTIGGENFNFRNKATSVQFLRDDCAPNTIMELEMFPRPDYKGKVIRIFDTDVARLSRADDNTVASARLGTRDSTRMCQVCMYREVNYQGEKRCVNKDTPTFSQRIDNSVSSIRLETGACADGGATIHADRNYGGSMRFVMQNIPDLRRAARGNGNWNNHLSSIRFSPNMAQVKADAEQAVRAALPRRSAATQRVDPATVCEVCVYRERDYKGDKQCFDGNANNFSSRLNNSVSSIKISKGSCPRAGVIVYKNRNHGGESAIILNSDPDLRSVQGNRSNWNNNISSLKFSRTQRDIMVQAAKRAMPRLSDAQAERMITQRYGE